MSKIQNFIRSPDKT